VAHPVSRELTFQDRCDIDTVDVAMRQLEEHRDGLTQCRQLREHTLRSMRARGWGLGELAFVFGVSKARMQQLTGRKP
jgi:hypothetical protein